MTARLHRARRSAPWLHRGLGPLLLSGVVHAAAVGAIGGVLAGGSGPRAARHEPELLDVDVAPVAATPENAPSPQPGPAMRRRLAARPVQRPASAPAVPPAPATTTPPPDDEAPPARFALSAGTIATNALPAAAPASTTSVLAVPGAGTPGPGVAAEPGAVREGDVDVPARLLAASPLVYPPAARRADIEIDLPLEIVVDASGRVVSARMVTRAGYGLDEAALHGIRAYRFSPAMRAGRAVAVRMRWIVQFRLR